MILHVTGRLTPLRCDLKDKQITWKTLSTTGIEAYRPLRSRTAGRAEPCTRKTASTVIGLSS